MSFFQYDYDPSVKFDMYTSMHLLMLMFTAVLFVLFFVFKNRISSSAYEKHFRYGLGVFLIMMLITLIIIDTTGGHLYLP